MTKPRFTQYFRGSLSGLTIRPGKIESQKVISCLQACKEGLDINSLESLDKSIKVFIHALTFTQKGDFNWGYGTILTSINIINRFILKRWLSYFTTIVCDKLPLGAITPLTPLKMLSLLITWPHFPYQKKEHSPAHTYDHKTQTLGD